VPDAASARPLRIGFVGCGRVAADLHLPALARIDGVEAVALADPDTACARRVAGAFGVPRVHPDAATLAADPTVDLVAVCSPPRHHAEGALAALAAGRHLFVEKPLALDLETASAIVAATGDRLAAAGFNLRVHRQVIAAREALAEGRLGELRMVRTHWTAAARPPGWRSAPAEGGSALWELAIHHLDLWRHLTGREPPAVRATGDAGALAIAAELEGGPLLATTVAVGTSDANQVELVGEHGSLLLDLYRGDGPRWTPVGRAAGGVGVRLRAAAGSAATLPRQALAARAGGDYRLSYAAEWAAVLAAVREGAPPPADLEDGRRAVALAVAAEESLRDGGAIAVAA
jgi:myo-inositol 2-dehydrogenase / D-chiro-inositol 1-dehydrogenase